MNNSWMVLLSMALLLGVRHGFDLDHLSIIDSITRTVNNDLYFYKLVGVLFSLGHGIVVTFASLVIGSGLIQSQVPTWLNNIGNLISIFFLFVFSFITFLNIITNYSHAISTSKLNDFVLFRIKKRINPLIVILIGALFAFSFDTISQVALFSLSASAFAGWPFAGVLGITFTLGMMISDGLNGLITSAIIKHADITSFIFSRTISFAIALFSLVIGMMNLMKAF